MGLRPIDFRRMASGSGPTAPPTALKGVYLRPLPDALLPARHSAGARVRAGQLQAFLRPLQEVASRALVSSGAIEAEPTSANVTLLVANSKDWQRLCRYPYGLPFTRTAPGGRSATVVAAADYQPRLLRRFDDVALTAGKASVAAPGNPSEFLDLMIGHEWGHAFCNVSGLRTRLRWLDELNATYLLVQAVHAAGLDPVLERLAAWARWQVAGTEHDKGDLASFEYPRGRAGFARLLWYQGVFAERALEMAPGNGWDYLLGLRAVLPGADRGRLARTLIELDPSFKPWFAVFGTRP